jgi:hypothetical protein
MKGKLIQIIFITWIVIVIATHWILRGAPGFKSGLVSVPSLRWAHEILSSWFYAPYGS